MNKNYSKAVTFMELLIVVVITGILAAIAIPSYVQTLREHRRQDAIQALQDGKSKIEQYILANNSALPATLAAAGINATSVKGYYTMSYTPGSGTAYTLTATAVPAGIQGDDTGCTAIWISDLYDDTQPSTCK